MNELQKQLDEFEDAVWCSRGDVLSQNNAAKERATKAKAAIMALFDSTENQIRIDENKKLLALLNLNRTDREVRMFYFMRPLLKKRINALKEKK